MASSFSPRSNANSGQQGPRIGRALALPKGTRQEPIGIREAENGQGQEPRSHKAKQKLDQQKIGDYSRYYTN